MPQAMRARPQLIAVDGEIVWSGNDVEVIPSPGDPNWRPRRNVISIAKRPSIAELIEQYFPEPKEAQ